MNKLYWEKGLKCLLYKQLEFFFTNSYEPDARIDTHAQNITRDA